MKALVWPVALFFAVALLAVALLLGMSISSEAELSSLQSQSFAQGQAAAHMSLKTGGILFLAGAHGWGLNSVPGFHDPAREMCIIKNLKVRKYREYTDAWTPQTREQQVTELQQTPQKTYSYASGFNLVMTAEAMNRGIRTCF